MKRISNTKKRNALCFLLVAVTLSLLSPYFFVAPVSAAGSTYYVSPSGSNTNPGTLAQPWKTIQKAANSVTQGDTVYIRGGTYNEKITFSNVQGTSTAWIKFAPYNEESVIISGSGIGTGYDGIFELNDGCKYIRITGFEIKNTNGHGIFLFGGEINTIRIDHCTIHNCQSSGIYAYSAGQPTKYVRNIEFDYNTVYDVNNGLSYSTSSYSPQEAISFSNVQGFNIHHNTLSNYGKEGIDVKSGSSSGSVHHNTITTSRASPAFHWNYNHIGIYIDGFSNKNHDIDVYNNRITGYGGPGIVIGAESGGSIEDISIYNNIIALSYLPGHISFRAIDSCYDCQFKNVFIYSNTLYNGESTNSPIRIFPSAANIINVVIRNNIITGTAHDILIFQELRSTEVSGRLTLSNNLYYRFGGSAAHNLWKNGADKSWGSTYVLTDPKYVSRYDNNLHLLSSSPAINTGTASTAPSTDFEGVTRPQGNGIDIGAYEYVSTTNNPVVFSGMSPANGTTNVPISTSSLSVTMQDPEGKAFSYSIQTRPNVGSKSQTGVYNGVKTCTLSGLAYGTTYRWWVNASDGSSWTRRWYTFTTVTSNPVNNPLLFTSTTPANGTLNVPISTSSILVSIRDPEGKAFSYSIQTRPNVGSKSQTGVYNGTKTCTLSGLAYGTTYRWWVNASDGSSWTRRWYTFTTASNPANNPPVFTLMSPADGSKNVPMSTSALSLFIKDPEGKAFSFTIQTSPNVGRISVNNVYDSTKYCTLSGLAYGTTYRWWVNASDGSGWTRRWYTFTTETYDPRDPPPGGGGGGTDSPPADGNQTPPLQNHPPNTPEAPVGQMSIECGTNYTYTSYSIDSDNDQIRLQIDWGDGNLSGWSDYVNSNTTVAFTHAWISPSTYILYVLAQDDKGSLSNWSAPLAVTVTEPVNITEPPIIDIITINNGSVNQTIIFDASNSTLPDGELTSYHWNFGDGSYGSGPRSHHTYTQPGVYQVNLTVTDESDQTYTKTIEVIIDVQTEVPVNPKYASFSYTSTALLIAECVIVIGMMFILRQRNILKERSKKHKELSVEEKVDLLLCSKTKK